VVSVCVCVCVRVCVCARVRDAARSPRVIAAQDLRPDEWADTPNPLSPAQEEAYRIFQKDKVAYELRVKAQVKQYNTDKYLGAT